MPRATLRAKGQLTLPKAIRTAAQLEDGDLLEAEITDDGILLRPCEVIDATQAWFWAPTWQAGERDADVDRVAGRLETFDSDHSLIDALGIISTPVVADRSYAVSPGRTTPDS